MVCRFPFAVVGWTGRLEIGPCRLAGTACPTIRKGTTSGRAVEEQPLLSEGDEEVAINLGALAVEDAVTREKHEIHAFGKEVAVGFAVSGFNVANPAQFLFSEIHMKAVKLPTIVIIR